MVCDSQIATSPSTIVGTFIFGIELPIRVGVSVVELPAIVFACIFEANFLEQEQHLLDVTRGLAAENTDHGISFRCLLLLQRSGGGDIFVGKRLRCVDGLFHGALLDQRVDSLPPDVLRSSSQFRAPACRR